MPRKCAAFLLRREPTAKPFRSQNATTKADASKVAAAKSSDTKVAEYYVPIYAVAFSPLPWSKEDHKARAVPANKARVASRKREPSQTS